MPLLETRKFCLIIVMFLLSIATRGQSYKSNLIAVDSGWSANSVNTVPFRRNALFTHNGKQYICFYNKEQHVVVGRRSVDNDQWELNVTQFLGNAMDAHNSISISIDGDGYIHLAWDHHNTPLRYAKSVSPSSLIFEQVRMTGKNEESVTYPEFFHLKNGNLLFLFRDGGSGKGNLVVNAYDIKSQQWTRLHNTLIDGEGQRNAYWQAHVDRKGTIHLSWVWRESPDVASNHDLFYARFRDNGRSWENSNGDKYSLPITASNAEYAFKISTNSELINQTSMSADRKGRPFIATYWRTGAIPQYKLIYHTGRNWKMKDFAFRNDAFTLSGSGTKKIPIARPQVLVKGGGKRATALIVFRDHEREDKPSLIHVPRIARMNSLLSILTR